MPSLLAVYAHPDDESLFSGGVLARNAAEGGRTAVVTATWAEGTHRAAELAEALRLLGISEEPRLLGYADSRVPDSAPGSPRLCDAPLDEAVGRLAGHIRDVRPEIVVTHDAYGGVTGHEDHVRTHRLTVLAVQAAGFGRLYPEAGAPWQPRVLCLAAHPHSAGRAMSGLGGTAADRLWTVPDDDRITTTVDVRPWLSRKWAAIRAHRSEARRGAAPGLLAGLPADVREQLLGTEWYIRQDLVHAGDGGETELRAGR